MFKRQLPLPHNCAGETEKLYVIAVISNPARFLSRYELYDRFRKKLEANPHVELFTVEIALGGRPFCVTEANNPRHLQFRTWDEIWHKENMINLGIQYLSQVAPGWSKVAWIDADVEFTSPHWAEETLHQLEVYQVVQMFQHAIDMGPEGQAFQQHQGFMYSYLAGKHRPLPGKYTHWHPGYAWAARREALDMLGGLYDVSVLGSGDHLMAWALLGEGVKQLPSTMSDGYRRSLQIWQDRAERFVHRDVGYVKGTIIHYWHGKKRDRNYRGRWEILKDSQFNPDVDLKRDSQGLYQLNQDGTHRLIRLRDDIRQYMRSRNEDSVDLD